MSEGLCRCFPPSFNSPASGGGGPGSDTTAIHVDVASEIFGITLKDPPAKDDIAVIESLVDGYAKRKVLLGDLPIGELTIREDTTPLTITHLVSPTDNILLVSNETGVKTYDFSSFTTASVLGRVFAVVRGFTTFGAIRNPVKFALGTFIDGFGLLPPDLTDDWEVRSFYAAPFQFNSLSHVQVRRPVQAEPGPGIYSITSTGADQGKTFTNEGSTTAPAGRPFDLPSPTPGDRFRFVSIASGIGFGLRIRTQIAPQTIRIGTLTTAAGGFIEATAVGDTIELVAINTTEWVAESVQGTWTLT